MKNQDIFFNFTTNPSLADALADTNVGDTVKVELEVLVTSKDDKGISGTIQPDSVVPEGYEKEEPSDDNDDVPAPVPSPPGSLASAPVMQAMNLRKKGKQ